MKKEDFAREFEAGGQTYTMFDINRLEEEGIADIQRLPFSIRILVENLLRKLDGRVVTEEDLRNTFDFLCEFPKEIRCQAYGEMVGFPTYSYTRMSEDNAAAAADPNRIAISEGLPRETYDYYHRLFRLTRSEIPVEEVRAMGVDPKYRENPELLDPLLDTRHFYRFTAPASVAPQSDISPEAARTANASGTPSASGV